jgi:hypothetical protein
MPRYSFVKREKPKGAEEEEEEEEEKTFKFKGHENPYHKACCIPKLFFW